MHSLKKREEGWLRPFDTFRSFFDRFLDERFESLPEAFSGKVFTPLNISESENAVVVALELPGLSEEDFKVQVLGNQLTVSGEKTSRKEKKDEEFHRVESQYGSFSRTVAMPENVKADQIDAIYDNGILTLTIPKVEPTPTTQVKVKVKG